MTAFLLLQHCKLGGICLMVLVVFAQFDSIQPSIAAASPPRTRQQEYTYALQYLVGRFNDSVGLVSESEDEGMNALGFNSVNRTYWVASDNLWAQEALKDDYPEIASRIHEGIRPFLKRYGYPNLFEIVLGWKITFTIYDRMNLSVENRTIGGRLHMILYDVHRPEYNPNKFTDATAYADLALYLALNHCLYGDRSKALDLFKVSEEMWDGLGFYDKSAKSDRLYQNYKLGLFLFTERALAAHSKIRGEVETVVWSRQKLNVSDGFGGVTTLSFLNGKNYGTANVETTSILVLAYKDGLAEMVGSGCRPSTLATPSYLLLTIAGTAILLIAASLVFVRRAKRAKPTELLRRSL